MVPYSIKSQTIKINRLLLVSVIYCFLFSCAKKEADNGDYSDQYKMFAAELNKPRHHGTIEQEQAFVDSGFRKIKNPYTNDLFRYYSLKYLYYKKGIDKPKIALLYADSMLMMAKKSVTSKQYVSNYAEANFAMGDAYFSLSQYSTAYQCYYQGYFMGKKNPKYEILAAYTYRMGMVMFKQAHYDEAAKYFKLSFTQSLSYKENFQKFYQRQELLDNVGESFKNNGDIDSASVYFTKTLDYINNSGSAYTGPGQTRLKDVARAVVYGNQGEIAMLNKQHTLATQLLQKSIDINLKKGNDYGNAELVEINLGKLYFNTGQYQPFISLFKNLRNQLDSVKNEEAETSWNFLMSKYYVQTGDLGKAFNHLEKYNLLKDSIIKRSSTLKETDVNQQQANYDKQYQIENLKDNNKLQRVYICLAVICAVMAVVIVALVYRNWRKSKTDVKNISDLNKQINLQKNDLEVTLDELNVSSQEKDRILRTVAHDLRNPIGGIASLTAVMLHDDFNEEQKELIGLIRETSNNSLELINEILEVTNNGTVQFNTELVDINSLLTKSVDLLRFRAAEKDQKITLQLLAEQEDLLISREKIWRVISNLITNAIKFSPVGGIIYVSASANKNELTIAVKDTGIGIPDDVQDKVFNMFTEAKRPGTAGEKSFGLGLSISKQIVENHDGSIWFESNTKTGTTFYISLPRQKQSKRAVAQSPDKSVTAFA